MMNTAETAKRHYETENRESHTEKKKFSKCHGNDTRNTGNSGDHDPGCHGHEDRCAFC